MNQKSKIGENNPGLNEIKLPPRLPRNEWELDSVIELLGNRRQNELGAAARRKLENLIGIYPTV